MFRRSLVFRKQLLREDCAISRAVSGASSITRVNTSHAASLSTLRPTRLTSFYPQVAGRRWQSSEAEKKEATPADGEAQPAQTPEDAAKAELEKKNKEIIDLKVTLHQIFVAKRLTQPSGQISSFRSGFPQSSRSNEARSRQCSTIRDPTFRRRPSRFYRQSRPSTYISTQGCSG